MVSKKGWIEKELNWDELDPNWSSQQKEPSVQSFSTTALDLVHCRTSCKGRKRICFEAEGPKNQCPALDPKCCSAAEAGF
ncbi:hypothetical protein TorRG33x02_216850 [Trema orientale]|uniref:Uncharacterized protein n=1 Tax=Trema orientale TaxID=63057 RepID=A0A2P5EAH1_TREOI|nr:hypothetical protein TorRG33x02_216850 [Trema orientale]